MFFDTSSAEHIGGAFLLSHGPQEKCMSPDVLAEFILL
jgi:hypothetical protein